MSRYSNVFYYYRGPQSFAATNQFATERQVENNTTKALVNTLQHGGPRLARSFMREFAAAPGLALRDAGDVACLLQGHPTDVSDPTWLVGVSVLGEIDSETCMGHAGGRGRVDAALHAPGEALMLIEVKVVDRLDWQQLRRHAEDAGISVLPCSPTEWESRAPWRLVRWAEIYDWAARELSHATKESAQPARFLLAQLLEYLDLLGLAPFTGFRHDDFDFMASPPELRTWDRQAEVKARLAAFFAAVLARYKDSERDLLGEIKVGTLPLDSPSAWGQSHAGTDGVNLTVELWATELQLDLVAWRVSQAALFRRWLAAEPNATLAQLNGYQLIVFKRRAHCGPSASRTGSARHSQRSRARHSTTRTAFST